ncbi:DUF5050 domain-containing protein [Paenibacillus rhizovicinus]|uniref:DUF5050 domain-containing protein n=1 Tax=Paenibacillus rhizovicinus TaxID=2704463 RepID=A0A6C0P2P5_9BACL|nr:stalk domain-containing protein [Paenibacillus rhizovicinus]QHW30932.1 DUF5050 domain-containing protein [Paenibacillus rhizovicinus]
MRKTAGLMLACALCVSGTISAHAADIGKKKSLNEVFDQMVIAAYGQNKMFTNGEKGDFSEGFDLVQHDGHLFVPIRMMATLATRAGQYHGNWDAVWQSQAPNDVLLYNTNLHKTVKLTVDSKTMLINNKPQTMDVAPQKINGSIVLPLRSASEALDKKIDWLDGLILIGDENVDLQSAETLAVKDKVKAELTDKRTRVEYENVVYPLTKYGSAVYYFKRSFKGNSEIQSLFRKTDGQQETQVKLQGNPRFDAAKVIDHKLYYISVVNDKTELDALDLDSRTVKKVTSIDEWKPENGWVSDIRKIDNDLYLNLHSGDLTMGSETLYKAVQGAAALKVADGRSFIGYAKSGQYLYNTDFSPLGGFADNLSRTDLKTGKSEAFGEEGFSYGITRSLSDAGLGFGASEKMYIQDGYLYTLGYKDSDPKDVSAVYKLDLAKGTQVKLTTAAYDFWLVNNRVYYLDSVTGYVQTAGLDGSGTKTLIAQKATNIRFDKNGIYYTVNANSGDNIMQGTVYRYDLAKAAAVKLSDRPVRSYYLGTTGVYYLSDGYDLGLYKIDAAGRNVRLVHDSIDAALWTDAGMVFTKKYQTGIFSVQ